MGASRGQWRNIIGQHPGTRRGILGQKQEVRTNEIQLTNSERCLENNECKRSAMCVCVCVCVREHVNTRRRVGTVKMQHQLFMAAQAQSHHILSLTVFLWKDEVLAYEKNTTNLIFFLLRVDQNVS